MAALAVEHQTKPEKHDEVRKVWDHCEHVTFQVEGTLAGAMFRNCSKCQRKGSLLWFVPRDDLQHPGAR